MSYKEAMEAAGAEIHEFKEFGSYQGEWWAKVTYQGKTGWVNGCYGSCTVCDAFKAEFGYGDEEACEEHEYEDPKPRDCEFCNKAKAKSDKRIAKFGESYLEAILTKEAALAKAAEDIEWDHEAEEMVNFLKAAA